jgi:chromosome segregation ATPase
LLKERDQIEKVVVQQADLLATKDKQVMLLETAEAARKIEIADMQQSWQNIMTETNDELESKDDFITQLKSNLSEADRTVKKLENEVSVAVSNMEKTQEAQEKSAALVASLSAAQDNLIAQTSAIQEKMKATEMQIKNMENELTKQMEDQLTVLDSMLVDSIASKREVKELVVQNDSKMAGSVSKLLNTISRIQENESLKSQEDIAQAKKARDEMEMRVKSLEDSLAVSSAATQELRVKLDLAESKYQQMQTERKLYMCLML